MTAELPDGWRWVKLGEVASYINGRAFKPSDWGTDGLPIVRIQNLTNPTATFNRYDGTVDPRFYLDNGDLLVAWSASLGVHWWQGGPAILNQHIFKVAEDPSQVSKEFFFHALTMVMSSLKNQAHGATMKHVTKPRFEATEIPLPPLDEQRRIAETMGTVERARAAATAQLAAIDELVVSMLGEIFPPSPAAR